MLRSSKYRMDASAKTEICLRPGAELIHRSGWEWLIFMHHLRRIAVELVPGHHRVAVVGPDKDADRRQCLREVPGERLGGGKRHHAYRSAERRVGTDCVSTIRSRGVTSHTTKKHNTQHKKETPPNS